MQVSHVMDGTKRKKPKNAFKKRGHPYRQSVGDELDVVEGDKVAKTNAEENKHRRTIALDREEGQPWGFTIQSYGILHKEEDEVELLTYIDYVAHSSPAFISGMRPGDVILSINGSNMEESDHQALTEFIKGCKNSMRMVVLFEDCCRKVELHHRYMKLKRVLAEKIFEVRSLEHQEMRVMSGLSRFDSCRSSRASTSSSNSNLDDRLSLLPELDRCPTPRNSSPYGGLPRSPFSPDVSSRYSSTRSLTTSPSWTPRFDFDRPSSPHRSKQRPHSHSLAASVSIHAALNASLRDVEEASGGSSPRLNSRYNRLSAPSDMTNGDRSPVNRRAARHRLNSSTPDYSLPHPNRSLRRSGRHASAPDKLNPPPPSSSCDLSEELELRLFKLHITGADTGESSTEGPEGQGHNSAMSSGSNSTRSSISSSLSSPSKLQLITGNNIHSPQQKTPKTCSSLPQLSELANKCSKKDSNQLNHHLSALSLDSSGSSGGLRFIDDDDSVDHCDNLAEIEENEPGALYNASSASSLDSHFSYSDLPAIQVEQINDEDAVSHL